MKHFSLVTNRSLADIVTLLGIVPFTIGIYLILQQQPELAMLSAIACFFIDSVDGVIARKFKLESDFGRQLDSAMDILIYLIFPSLFIIKFLNANTILSLITVATVVACGILRLVRFNTLGFVFHEGNRYYTGLGVAYILLGVAVLFVLEKTVNHDFIWVVPLVLFIMSLMMISEIHIKKPVLKFWYPIIGIITLIIIALYFKWL